MAWNWPEIAKGIGALLAGLAAVAAVWVGNLYTEAIKEREIQSRFVELAVDILRTEPTPETRQLRQWATKVVDQYSGVPLGDAESVLWGKALPSTGRGDVCFLDEVDRRVQCAETSAGCEEARARLQEERKSSKGVGECFLNAISWGSGYWSNTWLKHPPLSTDPE